MVVFKPQIHIASHHAVGARTASPTVSPIVSPGGDTDHVLCRCRCKSACMAQHRQAFS